MTRHIHTENMELYAQDAAETDKPWERWEFKNADDDWEPLNSHPLWHNSVQYRRIDPYRELKEARADGKVIQSTDGYGNWLSFPKDIEPAWNLHPTRYCIKPDTVEMYQWIYRKSSGKYAITPNFYSSQRDCECDGYKGHIVQRADWTRIKI